MSCFGGENKAVVCHVVLLDESEIAIEIKSHTKGQELLNQVYNRINLFERDYFGLRFLDHCEEARWLDPQKSIIKQNRHISVFYFGVRFYSSDPCKLQEEITRYLFFQQLKRDILQSRLHCSFTVATRLFAYVVQAELGDFDQKRHTLGYVSEFRFLPNQSEEMEEQAEQIHKTLKNMVPADCEMEFLDKAKWLDLYGADMHHVRGEDGVDYEFGIKPSGLLVKKRGNIIGNYVWPKISKLYFKGKKFYLSVWGKSEKEDSYIFVLPRKSSCKHLWKNCVEHHAFFRLEKITKSAPPGQIFFRFGSKHRYSGRTQYEALQESMRRKRQGPEVLRKASKKYPRRSFQEKRKATPGLQGRKSPSGHSQHGANGNNRWSQSSAEQKMNGVSRPGGLYTTGERTPIGGSHLAKFPKPGRRPGHLSGSDTESGRRRRGGRNYVSDDEADVRRRRHRRRRNNRGYASAGDASGTETEGANQLDRPRVRSRGYYTETEEPYDSTAQWVDSTQNLHQASRERQGRSYEDVRSRLQRQELPYKSEPDITLSPALVPVQKSSVSVARVREDRGRAHRYSGSHLPHESLYKVRSESANNKLNFKVLLELGPETGMPHDAQANMTQRSRGNVNSYEQRSSNHRTSGGYATRQDNYEHSPPRRTTAANGYPSSRSHQRSSNGYQFVGMKSTEL